MAELEFQNHIGHSIYTPRSVQYKKPNCTRLNSQIKICKRTSTSDKHQYHGKLELPFPVNGGETSFSFYKEDESIRTQDRHFLEERKMTERKRQ